MPHPPTTSGMNGTIQSSTRTSPIRSSQFAKAAVEFYALGAGKTGHSAIYLEHLRRTVASAREARITYTELKQQLAAAELASMERRELMALVRVVIGMERMGIGFDKLSEVREVVMLKERHMCMERQDASGEKGPT